jgi:putative DNA primase/helicase
MTRGEAVQAPAPSTLAEAAVHYAEQGIPVFPCRSNAKTPLTPRGFKDATTNVQQVVAWWRHWPRANIAMATGSASGRFVIDVDNEPDKGIDGLATWSALERQHGEITTPRVLTPRGGMHLYFRHVEGLGSTSGKLGPGVDTRGNGGYVLLPPSVVNGKCYVEDVGATFDDTPLTEPPAWLVARLLTPQGHPEAVSLPDNLPEVPLHTLRLSPRLQAVLRHGDDPGDPGRYPTRSEALFAVLTTLVRSGHSDSEIAAVLLNPAYAAGEKARQQGKRWLAQELTRAREKLAEERLSSQESAPDLASSVLDFQALLRLAIPERQVWLPWFPERGLAMVYGTRGVGKTYFGLSLALSLATGIPFLSWDTRPTGGLYVDGEMPLADLRERLVKLVGPRVPGGLYLLSSEQFFTAHGRDFRVTDAMLRQALDAWLAEHEAVRVVILDNISTLCTGISEDKKGDWEPMAAWLIQLRCRGLATALFHHAGKTGMQRGTSGREDILDTVIALRRPATYHAEEGCHFTLHFEKARGVVGETVQPLDVTLVTTEQGSLVWTFRPLEASQREQIIALLAEGETNVRVIAEEVGCSERYVRRIKREWERGT